MCLGVICAMVPKDYVDLLPDLVAWRRHLHAHPELGYEEFETQSFILSTLAAMGLKPRPAGGTGVVVDLGDAGPRILARADIDALGIQENSDVSYRSANSGVMHACGHDGHMAMMLGVARMLSGLLPGHGIQARLIFQPAEERHPGGALKMIADGVLDGVDRVTGLHLQASMPSGRIGARRGFQSANSDRFVIRVNGRGGHASAPQDTIDPIPVAAQLVTAIQHLVARMVDPLDSAVVTIGAINGGTTFNAIPSLVELKGTVRTFKSTVRDMVESRLAQLVSEVSRGFGAVGTLEYMRGYPAVVNTDAEWRIFRQTVEEAAGAGVWLDTEYQMGGEDFAYYVQERPGVFWDLGAQPPSGAVPHHHERFDFDESVMPLGVWVMVETILAFARIV